MKFNVFYSTFTNVFFYFLPRFFTFFQRFLNFNLNVFLHLWSIAIAPPLYQRVCWESYRWCTSTLYVVYIGQPQRINSVCTTWSRKVLRNWKTASYTAQVVSTVEASLSQILFQYLGPIALFIFLLDQELIQYGYSSCCCSWGDLFKKAPKIPSYQIRSEWSSVAERSSCKSASTSTQPHRRGCYRTLSRKCRIAMHPPCWSKAFQRPVWEEVYFIYLSRVAIFPLSSLRVISQDH